MYASPDYCLLPAGVGWLFCWLPNKCQSNARSPSGFLAAPCRKMNAAQQNRNTDIAACNRTIQSNKGLTGALLEDRQREREYISTVQCLPSSSKHALSCPYCVRSPCSPQCKHPLCTPSGLYSDPEQEVIS